jgi:hypothetical protein
MPSTSEIPGGYYLKISSKTADAINALDECSEIGYREFWECIGIVKDSLLEDIDSPEIIFVHGGGE